MSTILNFPNISDLWKSDELRDAPRKPLKSDWTCEGLAGAKPITATILHFVRDTDDMKAHLFKVQLSGAPSDVPQIVFCTVAWGHRCAELLQKEEEVFRQLKPVQGDVVPKAFGAFHGILRGDYVRVFVFEYCGVPGEALGQLTLKQRAQLFDAFVSIHQCGVELKEFRARHLFFNNNGATLKVMYFRDADRNHVCKYNHANPPSLQGEPSPFGSEKVGCDEIWLCCQWIRMLTEAPTVNPSAIMEVSELPVSPVGEPSL